MIIPPQSLQAGDLLLSLGKGNLSEAIRALDGGRYSHAALWTGRGVIESTLPRVVEHDLAASLSQHPREYVDAYRFRAPFDVAEVLRTARSYLERPYARGDLLLGALVITTSTLLPKHEWRLRFLVGACQLDSFLSISKRGADD